MPNALGPNAWLVDEMHEQYLADAGSVSESWRDFFEDYKLDAAPQTVAAPAAEMRSMTRRMVASSPKGTTNWYWTKPCRP